jgi:hypothetical protein
MPRHRQGNIPKHRARRSHENTGRHTQLNAANPAKLGVSSPGPGDDGGGGGWPVTPDAPTQPFARLPGALPAPGWPGRPARPGSGGDAGDAGAARRHRMRGLLVTPWFAAGAGVVIAAALSLNSPRTFLTYRPNTSKCAECTPAGAGTGTKIKTVHPAQVDGSAGHAATPPPARVGVQVGAGAPGFFTLTFTVPASQAGNGWKLGFDVPSGTITYVQGAQWRPNAAGDGGVAVAPGAGRPGSLRNRIIVSARGTPVSPAGCVLNGRGCRFRLAG